MKKSVRLAVILAAVLGPLVSVGWVALQWRSILAPPGETTTAEAGPGKPSLSKPKSREWDFATEEFENASKELREERDALDVRKKDLDATEQRIAAEKEELKRLRSELEATREEITQAVPAIKAAEMQNLKNLAKVYGAMRPAQAVSILVAMDDASIVKLLSTMKGDAVGQIFAEMARTAGPDGPLAPRAAKLSEQLRLLQKPPQPNTTASTQ